MKTLALHGKAGFGSALRAALARVGRGVGLAVALIVALGHEAVAAEGTKPPSAPDYASFRVIAERNIFSANRSGRSSRGNREAPRPVKVDSFALLGTMSYDKGDFAFFDGSSSQFRKTLKRAEVIGDFKVVDICQNSVKLEAKNQQIELRIGAQIRREDGGEWKLASRNDGYPGSSGGGGGTASSASAGSSSDGAGSGGGVSEALKRMLEQREKEMK